MIPTLQSIRRFIREMRLRPTVKEYPGLAIAPHGDGWAIVLILDVWPSEAMAERAARELIGAETEKVAS